MSDLRDKVAIVTGGASGIGLASATALAAAGAAVVIADVDKPGADACAEKIRRAGGEADAVAVDVAEAEQVAAMVEHAVGRYGGLDVLFNNAAILEPTFRAGDTDVEGLDLEVWDRTLAVNLRGPMLGCRFAIPHLRRRGGGAIVNCSSSAAETADFIRCAYGTSKGGLNSLTRYVAAAFGKDGIRCNAIAPGLVITPAVQALWTQEALDDLDAHHMTRIGAPDDIARMVVFLAGDAGSYLTGQVITVDGGFSGHLPTYRDTVRKRAETTRKRAETARE
jgi:NAD(P)-dependent dehydrogenase (short-subunit alcohol dehydrogenase family)